eukprot:CAMPEP_0202869646 /NCGR_PEP_ID=MMETSP1391-20130828/12569_1 /ASSEMBLY_ACC=CAM_ASM_000867 /TAXON_ID=1034604 /ORGANISM="Chlamydomonas leiostraca, Strain SAG 11-49" /LENGTH=80 /DNA_ID=CAMNT_0049549987 /DNA_START=765 /DNA_END=1004 /DNA_ORIENTATION=-
MANINESSPAHTHQSSCMQPPASSERRCTAALGHCTAAPAAPVAPREAAPQQGARALSVHNVRASAGGVLHSRCRAPSPA